MNEPMLKSQTVRKLDVFLYGPFMIYIAYRYNLKNIDKLLLAGLGVGTIWYNARNYLRYERLTSI
jgi:hypothetical protein